MGRLLHPSMVAGGGAAGRGIQKEGVYVAWLFFMLFALSITAIWIALAVTGLTFDVAMLATVSALSNTGPLAPVVSDGAIAYGAFTSIQKTILIFAMILGRLEALALISLLNPDIWRK